MRWFMASAFYDEIEVLTERNFYGETGCEQHGFIVISSPERPPAGRQLSRPGVAPPVVPRLSISSRLPQSNGGRRLPLAKPGARFSSAFIQARARRVYRRRRPHGRCRRDVQLAAPCYRQPLLLSLMLG